MKLLVATGNKGKIKEIGALLKDAPYEVLGLSDFPGIVEVEETGNTFAENAILKARGYAGQTGCLTLADDSGLEVLALGGAPGVFSARYGGADTGYNEKIALLLDEIDKTGSKDRRARFACVMALASETGGIIHTSEGFCEGRIGFEPVGDNGFGYDPVFIPDGYGSTFGELADDIKQQISHRARAINGIIRFLAGFRGFST